jgi:hypothetical protein
VSGGVTLVDALAKQNVSAVFFGHDHGNEWCCHDKEGMLACYGKHSGFGGYFIGSRCPGARVIDLFGNGTLVTRLLHFNQDDPACQLVHQL